MRHEPRQVLGHPAVVLPDAYAHRLAEPMAALVVALAPGFSHIAAPGTTDARNVLPRAAALLDVMVIPEVSRVVDADTFERSVYTSAAVQTVKSADATKVLTVRIASFDAAGEGGDIGRRGHGGLKLSQRPRPEQPFRPAIP